IVRAALEREFVYVVSEPLMNELETVLRSTKFGLTFREISDLTEPLFEVAEVVVPQEEIKVIERCPADNAVLECAVAGACGCIVSGDKRDLVRLGTFRGIAIISPKAFHSRIR